MDENLAQRSAADIGESLDRGSVAVAAESSTPTSAADGRECLT